MLLVASGRETVRIRHGDKGSLCHRMSNALTDESETLLSLFLSVFSCSFSLYRSLLSSSIHSTPHSTPPSHTYLYLSEAVSLPFTLPLLLSLAILFSSCQMFFRSPFQTISLFPVSIYSLATVVCLFLLMYAPPYLKPTLLYWLEYN